MDREAWNDRYRGAELVWSATPNAFVAAEVADLRPGHALDLAAGECRNAVWLAEAGWQVTAVDFSAAALDTATRVAEARGVEIELVECDLVDYEPARGAYDLVLIAYLQVPEGSRSHILDRAAKAVASDGTLLVVAHDRANLDGGHGGPQDPAVLATAEEMAALIANPETALVLDRAAVVERVVDSDDGPRVALDHVVRAHRPG